MVMFQKKFHGIFLFLISQCKNLSFTDDSCEQKRKKEEEKANTNEKVGNLITFNVSQEKC